ncbi:hypothetical protein [Ectopseudomonas mendocina]|uniref:Uncharacterized protein n=1 Tax=Ectopseudomonas mendocina TaxID=300 RepID=A0A2R3QWV4_ECTME|nr:hypothetical protein [Pseudomonas mendocina]AVO56162.1 hypothetical protein C7A17_26605 [Pseudomonas mendocina]
MKFISNYAAQVALASGVTELALALPDGVYRLTMSDARGADATRFEYLDAAVVSGIATLTRALEGSADQDWPDGSWIYCSITAGVMEDLQSQIDALGWTPGNFVQRLEQGEAGQGDLFWSAAGVGAYARVAVASAFGFTQAAISAVAGVLSVVDGYVSASGSGAATSVQSADGQLVISTGTTATGTVTLGAAPGPAAGFASVPDIEKADVAAAEVAINVFLPTAPSAAQDLEVDITLGVPGLGGISLRQSRLVNDGNLVLSYQGAEDFEQVNTSAALSPSGTVLVLLLNDTQMELATRPFWGSTSKTTLATVPLGSLGGGTAGLGFTASLSKTAGTTSRTLAVSQYAGYVRLR